MRDLFSIERATADLQGRAHSVELQSIRGIAAMAVLFHHCTFYYGYDAHLKRMAEIVLNAHAAVVTFFVLSGFVLTISLSRKPIGAKETLLFYVRRAFRIYPALWVAVLLGLSYMWVFRGVPIPDPVSAWWNPKSRHDPALAVVALSFAGIFTHAPVPIWSLFVELVGSMLMPLIAWLLFARTRLFLCLLVVFLVLSQLGGASIFTAPVFLIDFGLGAAIVLVAPAVRGMLRNNGLALAAGIAAFGLLWFGRNLVAGDFLVDYDSKPAALIEGVAATALITLVYIRSDLFGFLRWKAFLLIGDISYSLYLVHMALLGFIAGVGGEFLGIGIFARGGLPGTFALMLVVPVISLAVAALCYRFVEVPMMRLGKSAVERLAACFKPRPIPAPETA